ncbi:type II toxin-antitoxin system PemK/MazF family toxin [Chloroflexota bacterium]
MRRGEIWWAELEPPVGERPVVLLSRNEAYNVRSLVIVAPVNYPCSSHTYRGAFRN